MVTRGCRTCVQRRVKCDTAKPICERCAKGKRPCIWNPNELGGLRFQDESAYAQGKARRPRNTKSSPPTAISATEVPLPKPQPDIKLSLDDHALQYWAQTNVSQADILHEAAHEWHTHVIPLWMRSKPGSCLHLAVSTLSRAVFGRARGIPQALVQADRSYAQCLYKTQQAVGGQFQENMDELLLTTMMMAYFENIRYSTSAPETTGRKEDAVGSRFTNVFCHYEGATGLLKIRHECGVGKGGILDKVTRRQIIRASILRGHVVPEWLQHGDEFGEVGRALEIDSFMVRVAAFRSRALSFFSERYSELSTSTPDLEYLAHTGKELEDDLVHWGETMSGEWGFRQQTSSEDFDDDASRNTFDGYSNSYTSHGHASLWLRQRALRLIINSIFLKFIAVRLQSAIDQTHLLMKQTRMQGNLDSVSRELCRDMPYYFTPAPLSRESSPTLTSTSTSGTQLIPANPLEILPSLASMLAWPLAIAVSTENVPEPQRQWLQKRLRAVANSLGDAVLHDVGNRGAFVF